MKIRSMKSKRTVIVIIVLLIISLFVIIFFTMKNNTGEEGLSDIDQQYDDVQRGDDGLPDYSTLDPNDFPIDENNSEIQDEEMMDSFDSESKTENSSIVIKSIQGYTGTFIETNQDIACENVATALIENRSEKMISYAIVSVSAGEDEWKFEISTIPANSSVIVQEKEMKKYQDVQYRIDSIEIAYEENASLMEDEIEIKAEGGNELTITNLSKDKIPGLRLFYKMKDDDIYIGGLTYVVKVSNLDPGQTVSVFPNHYTSSNAEVLMVRKYEE